MRRGCWCVKIGELERHEGEFQISDLRFNLGREKAWEESKSGALPIDRDCAQQRHGGPGWGEVFEFRI